MIIALDVDYRANETVTAKVIFSAWTDPSALREEIHRVAGPAAAYEPGQFFRRELPHLLASLGSDRPDAVVVDGYVWLAKDRPGLGARLHEAIGVPIVGVAKEPFRDNDVAIEVLRGSGKRPLFVTSEGIDPRVAAGHVALMDGPNRLPTLLKRVDHLCRTA